MFDIYLKTNLKWNSHKSVFNVAQIKVNQSSNINYLISNMTFKPFFCYLASIILPVVDCDVSRSSRYFCTLNISKVYIKLNKYLFHIIWDTYQYLSIFYFTLQSDIGLVSMFPFLSCAVMYQFLNIFICFRAIGITFLTQH